MDLSRRTVLQGAASATTATLVAGAAALLGRPALARPAQALRPPGALAEEQFLGACIRCGLCVRDCPPGNLKLSTWGAGVARDVAIGTPYFEARDVPCEMCEAIPCVKACPTGALDHTLTDINQARMGVAVLIDEENCLNFLGLRCDVCYRVCPVIDQAITLEKFSNPRSDRHAMLLPTVHAEHCTGCGKCEKSCVLEQAAIKVLPMAIARGQLGHHYVKNDLQEPLRGSASRGGDAALGRPGASVGGSEAVNRSGKPQFDLPVQRLPEHAVPGDLSPLRSGREAYDPAGAASANAGRAAGASK